MMSGDSAARTRVMAAWRSCQGPLRPHTFHVITLTRCGLFRLGYVSSYLVSGSALVALVSRVVRNLTTCEKNPYQIPTKCRRRASPVLAALGHGPKRAPGCLAPALRPEVHARPRAHEPRARVDAVERRASAVHPYRAPGARGGGIGRRRGRAHVALSASAG